MAPTLQLFPMKFANKPSVLKKWVYDMRSKREGSSSKESTGKYDELEGVYANTFKVGFNTYEFVLDFGQYFDEKGKEKFHTRIVTNSKYVEDFLEILSESMKKYKSGR